MKCDDHIQHIWILERKVDGYESYFQSLEQKRLNTKSSDSTIIPVYYLTLVPVPYVQFL
jgi:hypothetical protein